MRLFTFITIVVSTFSVATAQVTIGSSEAPLQGALLQLKENNNLEANSTKGLLLPRVQLLPTGKIKGSENINLENESTGLLVYNTVETDEYCIGVYIWENGKWTYLHENEESTNESTNYSPTTGILKDIEGNEYTTGDFGRAGIWMTQNLRTEKYVKCGELRTFPINGTPGVVDSDAERQIGYPNVYAGSISTRTFYDANKHLGLLYNWCAATNRINAVSDELRDATGVQGICPDGWHLPSAAEMRELMEEINENTSKYSSLSDIKTNISGTTLQKLGKAVLANNQPKIGTSAFNGSSNDVQNNGFAMYALGYGLGGKIQSAGGSGLIYSDIWTSSNRDQINAYYGFATYNTQIDYVELEASWNKRALFPVRCKKN